MAAPSGTTWGSTVGDYGRVGIYISTSDTNTQRTVTISTWFWSKYSCDDSNNSYYYNNNATNATTLIGSIDISTTVASGEGWSTSNQVKLGESSYTYDKGTSAVTRNCAIKLSNVDRVGGQMTHTRSYTIPALASYTISYNANGGSGAPSSQTKWHGVTLTLSSTKPTKNGYTFVGWGTSTTDTTSNYSAGSNYTSNASITLYAIWSKVITITYNANGGSGAPSAQSATIYNATTNYKFTLSATKPTKSGYTFLGWSTSSTATSASYQANASVTLSSSTTLYAIWSKTIVLAYNANGGTGAPTSQNGTIYNATTSYKFTISTTKPTKTGYTFLGWSTSSTATSSSYSSGGSVTLSNSTTIYAVWRANVLTINYHINGGQVNSGTYYTSNDLIYTTSSSSILADKWNYNSAHTNGLYNASTFGLSRLGYDFVGWKVGVNGKTIFDQDDTSVLPTDLASNLTTGDRTITLYAEWKLSGVVYIDDGYILDKYLIYIDNGNNWDLYLAYIDDGFNWHIIS